MEAFQGSSHSGWYHNQDQRNVHVWCGCSTKFFEPAGPHGLGVVAGCYKDDWLPISIFFSWLELIVPANSPGRRSNTDLVLFRGPDPRVSGALTANWDGGLQIAPAELVQPNSQENIKEGNYFLFQRDRATGQIFFFWPTLDKGPEKTRRTVTGHLAGAGTISPRSGSPRSPRVRALVRDRDKKCMVTGQTVTSRWRGDNFTSFEAAHIFPLHGVSKPSWTNHMAPNVKVLVDTFAAADQIRNAFLLRVDMHRLFDDYQWSVVPCPGEPNKYRLVCFEKSSLPYIRGHTFMDFNHTVSPPESSLFVDHLRTAILWNVGGLGQGFDNTKYSAVLTIS